MKRKTKFHLLLLKLFTTQSQGPAQNTPTENNLRGFNQIFEEAKALGPFFLIWLLLLDTGYSGHHAPYLHCGEERQRSNYFQYFWNNPLCSAREVAVPVEITSIFVRLSGGKTFGKFIKKELCLIFLIKRLLSNKIKFYWGITNDATPHINNGLLILMVCRPFIERIFRLPVEKV